MIDKEGGDRKGRQEERKGRNAISSRIVPAIFVGVGVWLCWMVFSSENGPLIGKGFAVVWTALALWMLFRGVGGTGIGSGGYRSGDGGGGDDGGNGGGE